MLSSWRNWQVSQLAEAPGAQTTMGLAPGEESPCAQSPRLAVLTDFTPSFLVRLGNMSDWWAKAATPCLHRRLFITIILFWILSLLIFAVRCIQWLPVFGQQRFAIFSFRYSFCKTNIALLQNYSWMSLLTRYFQDEVMGRNGLQELKVPHPCWKRVLLALQVAPEPEFLETVMDVSSGSIWT